MTNIVETWERVELAEGRTMQAALKDLNHATSKKYTSGRLSEWKRGKLAPPHIAVRYMAERVIDKVLAEAGIDMRMSEASKKLLIEQLTYTKNGEAEEWI